MLNLILQTLYELTQWQYFWFLLTVWIIIDLIWFGQWKRLGERVSKLITKPVIFEKDEEPDKPLLYPRRFMESLAQSKKSDNEADIENPFKKFVDAQRALAFNPEHPLRTFGYLITFVGFWFFAIADLIIIANTMVLMALMPANLPDLLQRLDYAILGGSFLSAIVGVWWLIEMSGNGELVNTDALNSNQRKIYKTIAAFVILIAILVMLALAVERLIQLGYLESSSTSDLILSFILYGLLAINNSLAAALTFSPMVLGLVVILFVISLILPLLMFILDVIWRFIYILVDIALWFLATPIIAVPYWILRLFGVIGQTNDAEEKEEEENQKNKGKPEIEENIENINEVESVE
ncbi:MAG: hypothetical protein LC099_07740 [Anaerolineales bacterium]|nr:hypothetical protein [Anaerolineales bacterium]